MGSGGYKEGYISGGRGELGGFPEEEVYLSGGSMKEMVWTSRKESRAGTA